MPQSPYGWQVQLTTCQQALGLDTSQYYILYNCLYYASMIHIKYPGVYFCICTSKYIKEKLTHVQMDYEHSESGLRGEKLVFFSLLCTCACVNTKYQMVRYLHRWLTMSVMTSMHAWLVYHITSDVLSLSFYFIFYFLLCVNTMYQFYYYYYIFCVASPACVCTRV